MTKNAMKEQLISCYINFNQTELRGACQNTQVQITRFFQNIMREVEKFDIEESNN